MPSTSGANCSSHAGAADVSANAKTILRPMRGEIWARRCSSATVGHPSIATLADRARDGAHAGATAGTDSAVSVSDCIDDSPGATAVRVTSCDCCDDYRHTRQVYYWPFAPGVRQVCSRHWCGRIGVLFPNPLLGSQASPAALLAHASRSAAGISACDSAGTAANKNGHNNRTARMRKTGGHRATAGAFVDSHRVVGRSRPVAAADNRRAAVRIHQVVAADCSAARVAWLGPLPARPQCHRDTTIHLSNPNSPP